MTKLKVTLMALMLCCVVAQAQDYTWETHVMDGSRTGCKAASAVNADETIGVVRQNGSYVAPSGTVFPKYSSTAKVASIVLEAQPEMTDLKSVIAYSEDEMPQSSRESKLSNWFVGIIMDKVSALSGKKSDVGICNFGGIRKGMPKGDVLLDDIQSMFPFKNYLVHLEMTGSELRKNFEKMAAGKFQAVGGVSIEVADGKLVSVLVGGEPLKDDQVYNVATISFLLHGGDGLSLADDSIKVDNYDVLIYDAVMEHINALTASGQSIKGSDVCHVVIR